MGWLWTNLSGRVLGTSFRYLSVDITIGRAIMQAVRQVFVSGASITAPFLVTLVVIGIVFDFIANLLTPFARILIFLGLTGTQHDILPQMVSLGLLIAVIFFSGVSAEAGATTGLGRALGGAMSVVPGVGSVYSSFDRMSDVVFENDGQSFRDVKLIEFPHTGLYSLAFQTAVIDSTTPTGSDEELLVLFVPLAPNPVMGGFMVCVRHDRVTDVDLTVREAFEALVTSGVVMADSLRRPTSPIADQSSRQEDRVR